MRVLERRDWGGRLARGDGEAAAFEEEFAALHDAPAALTVTNGTHALQLALEVSGVGPGDEVLVPALTPIPTANAVRRCGAVPVPVDVDPRTYCLDPARLAAERTERTKAVVAVHLGGHVADMDRMSDLGVTVIQDAAHAHGARWKDRGIGALGTIATFSFMQTKVLTAGEGGAVLLPDRERWDEAFSRHCLGRTDAGFRTASSNYRLSEFSSAVLLAQIHRLRAQNERREQRWRELVAELSGIPGVTPQGRDPRCTLHPHYLGPLLLGPEYSRSRVVAAMQAEGIPVYPLFPPIYRWPAFWDGPGAASSEERLAARCPVSERLGSQSVFLRHEALLGDERDVRDIADAFEKVLGALACAK
jgi:3-amino-5-hydroxybenzoate synthase